MESNRIDRFWLDRSVLVTGATGLVGSWLVKELVARRANVIALIRDWVPRCELILAGMLSKVTVVRGDVRDIDLIERIIAEYQVKTVIHLAAQTIVGVAERSPVSTFETNVIGTVNVLDACRRIGGVGQIIVASSDKAYGYQGPAAYDESMPLLGQQPYDASKACADMAARAYARTYDLPVMVTRCGNFYGGGDLNWSRIVPGTIRSVLRRERPIIRSDGSFVRDYFYVEDGVGCYLHAVESLSTRPSLAGEAFNFANESPVTVLALVQLILEAMNASDLSPIIQNRARNEIPTQRLSARKAREELGWRPRFGLETGLKETIAWYQQYFAHSMEGVHD